jgi:hypothetical protein
MTGFKRVVVLGAATAAMAAGALLGSVGSASAEAAHLPVGGMQRNHCDTRGGWSWERSHGHWVQVWHRTDRDCDRGDHGDRGEHGSRGDHGGHGRG